jgi:3-oxoacyl-[acyl-carrier protein] reductase
MRLKDRVAIVTGGASGIGRATVELFAKEGAKVIIWDISDQGIKLAQQLTQKGLSASFMKVSVADKMEVEHAVAEIIKQYSRIDILINNAGITQDRTLLKMSMEEWDKVININLTGVFICTQAVVSHMKNQNYGRIVSASSNVGLRGNYGQTNYVATKSAIIGMTKVWALELSKFGITSNCIAPGFIETSMTDAIPSDVKKQITSLIPLGYWGKPSDIANGFLYLSSDEGAYVNGICLVIDGGGSR